MLIILLEDVITPPSSWSRDMRDHVDFCLLIREERRSCDPSTVPIIRVCEGIKNVMSCQRAGVLPGTDRLLVNVMDSWQGELSITLTLEIFGRLPLHP